MKVLRAIALPLRARIATSPAVAPDPVARHDCPNCGATRTGRFCAACGQDNRHSHPRLRDWIADGVETLFSVDARWLRTVRELSLDPGGVIGHYLAGRRVRYVAPVRYAMVTCAIWWLCVYAQLPDLSDARIAQGLRMALLWGQPLNLCMLPPIAALSWVAFFGNGFNYAAHLCCVLFTCGHAFLWRAGLAGIGAVAPQWGPALNIVEPILFASYVAWAFWVWQRPTRSGLLPRVLVWLRIVAFLVIVFLASGLMLNQGVRVLVWLHG